MRLRIYMVVIMALLFTLATSELQPIWDGGDSRGFPFGWYTPSGMGWIPIIGPFLDFSLATFNFMYFLFDFAIFCVVIILVTVLVGKENGET